MFGDDKVLRLSITKWHQFTAFHVSNDERYLRWRANQQLSFRRRHEKSQESYLGFLI